MTEPRAPGISFEFDERVLTATLDSAGGNVMSAGMCDALAEVLLHPPAEAHVLVLRATGPDFCLGRERSAISVDSVSDEVGRLIALNRAFAASRLVTVSRVHGDAAGYGVGLAALADVAVATRAARFSFPEVRMGLAPSIVVAWLQPLVGPRQAFWLTASGVAFSAEQAAGFGMLNEVVDDIAELDAAVQRRVSTVLAGSPRVHAEIKQFLRVTSGMTAEHSYELAGDRLALASLRRVLGADSSASGR